VKAAVFSDVHGNLPALEVFVESTRDEVDMYICLGDVVDYGPWNDECLELVMGLPNIVLLEGNHERLFLGTEDLAHELPLVQEFYKYSIKGFSRRDLIENLPAKYDLDEFICCHTIDERRVYRDTEVAVSGTYIIGHTHHAFDVRREHNRIINCGSIGQNRRRVDRLSYAIVDPKANEVSLRELDYPVTRLLEEMRRRHYSQVCLDYYQSKLPSRQIVE
jgi:predicted phosphodiesterase